MVFYNYGSLFVAYWYSLFLGCVCLFYICTPRVIVTLLTSRLRHCHGCLAYLQGAIHPQGSAALGRWQRSRRRHDGHIGSSSPYLDYHDTCA